MSASHDDPKPTDPIRDSVFPVFEVEISASGEMTARAFRGTGFFIGDRNHALTAAHVVADPTFPLAALLVADDGSWRAFGVRAGEAHPTEDIAVLSIEPRPDGDPWRSLARLSAQWAGSSAPYFLFGYPEDTVFEIFDPAISDVARPRPDLIYSEGHIRRRMSYVPTNLTGLHFFELSSAAGGGCSGGPLLAKPHPLAALRAPQKANDPWDLIGVYVGERVMSESSELRELFPGLATVRGYALRIDAVADWRPELLEGLSLMEAFG